MAGVTFRADFGDKLIDILTDKDYDLMGRAVKLGEETKARL